MGAFGKGVIQRNEDGRFSRPSDINIMFYMRFLPHFEVILMFSTGFFLWGELGMIRTIPIPTGLTSSSSIKTLFL